MAGFLEITRITRANDETCNFCSRRDREGKTLRYFAVKYAPSSDSNRNVMHICEDCAASVGAALQAISK